MKEKKEENMSNSKRKAGKRKAKLKKLKKLQPQNRNPEEAYIRDAIKQGVYDCQSNGDIETGMIAITLYKQSTSKVIVMAGFVVDLYCLGIKNAFIKAGTMEQYESVSGNPDNSPIDSEDAKKLIEEAVEYAMGLGFKPHKDFKKAFKIFDNIDSSKSTMEFTFGKDGKPFFIAGPRDSPQRCNEILKTLNKHTGDDGSNFLMPNSDIEKFDEDSGEWEINKTMFD